MGDEQGGHPWYHGSPRELPVLRLGSSITQNVAIARAFSRRPRLVSIDEDTGAVKHDGTTPGYLYVVDEELSPDDVSPHPHPVNQDRWEWITHREVRIRLLGRTEVGDGERLTPDDIAELRHKQEQVGLDTFTEKGPAEGHG